MSNNDSGHERDRGKWREKHVYTGKCDVRLTKEEDSMLNQLAERNDVTRSEIFRKALRDFYKFNTEE